MVLYLTTTPTCVCVCVCRMFNVLQLNKAEQSQKWNDSKTVDTHTHTRLFLTSHTVFTHISTHLSFHSSARCFWIYVIWPPGTLSDLLSVSLKPFHRCLLHHVCTPVCPRETVRGVKSYFSRRGRGRASSCFKTSLSFSIYHRFYKLLMLPK